MTANEAVTFYLEQKQSNKMSKADIRTALENEFDASDADFIFKTILDQELIELQNQKSPLAKILDGKAVSYFFIVFGLVAIATSIYIISLNQGEINQYLPWIMIIGAGFIVFKHIRNIRKD